MRHALRNALLPVVTVIGLEFAFLIGGLVVTEQVFNLNGIGKLLVEAVSAPRLHADPGADHAARASAFVAGQLPDRPALLCARPAHPLRSGGDPRLSIRASALWRASRAASCSPSSRWSCWRVVRLMSAAAHGSARATTELPARSSSRPARAPSARDRSVRPRSFDRLIFGSRTALLVGITASFVGTLARRPAGRDRRLLRRAASTCHRAPDGRFDLASR